MIGLLVSYFIYNIVAGIFIALYCYYYDDYKSQGYDLLWVFLFPAIGWGFWRYNKELRDNGKVDLPGDWYMWTQMIKVNWGFLICIGFLGFGSAMGCHKMVGGGIEWANHQNNGFSLGLGLLYDIGSGIAFLFFMVMLILGLGILFAIFILIPTTQSNSIETRYYKEQLLKERQLLKRDTSQLDNNNK